MTVRLTQPQLSGESAGASVYRGFPSPAPWNATPPWESEPIPWSRYLDALKRHAPLMLAVVLIGSALGLFAARRVKPEYNVQATLWINPASGHESSPIR